MLEYRLDDLSWQEFERLCQTLLKAHLGVGVEAWGGSGDWGNDAYCQSPLTYPGSERRDGPFQFQVKYIEGANAAGARPQAALLRAVKKECQRIKRRAAPPPMTYSLLTNVVLSGKLRQSIRKLIGDSVPGCEEIVIHGGNDLCSWLHLHRDVVQGYPKLLSHRDLLELVSQVLQAKDEPSEAVPSRPASPAVLDRIEKARVASRAHRGTEALRLWGQVREQAKKEGHGIEEIFADLEMAVILANDEGRMEEAIALAENALKKATDVELGQRRCRLLHLVGEMYRVSGNRDQARGFLNLALTQAKEGRSIIDEGYALLSLSALAYLEASDDHHAALELVDRAFDAFSIAYSEADSAVQRQARDGCAQCHRWRAEVIDSRRPDEALGELSRALGLFQDLGEGWEWDVADIYLHRAELRGRLGESRRLVFADLARASAIFKGLRSTYYLARCYLSAGEALDRFGDRQEALESYEQAYRTAKALGDHPRASYMTFRYACKLIELRKYDNATRLLTQLADADWLDEETRLTVISQLCLVAQVTDDQSSLTAWTAEALRLVEVQIDKSTSGKKLRHLTIQKAQYLIQLERHQEALKLLEAGLKRFEAARDQAGLIECLFQIRGVMQSLGDRNGEREFSERLLALGAEEISPTLAALTLVGLAQLAFHEQHYNECLGLIERAVKLDPTNPAVKLIGADLRSRLPRFRRARGPRTGDVAPPPSRDVPTLFKELNDWCQQYPKKRKSIVALWYYLRYEELISTLRSMLGVKFLVCAASLSRYRAIASLLKSHGDLLAWGTNFSYKPWRKRVGLSAEVIPVPKDFPYPAGTTVVTPKTVEKGTTEVQARPSLLRPVINETESKPYYLAYVRDDEGGGEVVPMFGGNKKRWVNPKVPEFILKESGDFNNKLCLPLSQSEGMPKLHRIIRLAHSSGLIPVFANQLPDAEGTESECDVFQELPASQANSKELKNCWSLLLTLDREDPAASLREFAQMMAPLVQGVSAFNARIYVVRCREELPEVIHPVVVILKPCS